MSYIYYPATCGPKGHGSGSATAEADGSSIFSAFKPIPVPNSLRVKPGLPDLLFPISAGQRKRKTPNQTKADCSSPPGLPRGRLKPLLVLRLARILLLGDRGLVLGSLGAPSAVGAAIVHHAAPVLPIGIGPLVPACWSTRGVWVRRAVVGRMQRRHGQPSDGWKIALHCIAAHTWCPPCSVGGACCNWS